jgi:hypothetical protein
MFVSKNNALCTERFSNLKFSLVDNRCLGKMNPLIIFPYGQFATSKKY